MTCRTREEAIWGSRSKPHFFIDEADMVLTLAGDDLPPKIGAIWVEVVNVVTGWGNKKFKTRVDD